MKYYKLLKDLPTFKAGELFYINKKGNLCAEDSQGMPEIDKQNFVVEQFTSLKDKNGKEIYEGDILCLPAEDNEPALYSEVVYANGGFNAIISGYYDPLADALAYWEVIGNIHENPELLKEE